MGVDALALGYLSFDHPEESDFRRTEQRCISCGACAADCPTGAMRIEDRGSERILSLCGTVLSRQPLVFCSGCGANIGTERYRTFIRDRLGAAAKPQTTDKKLCDICVRKKGHSRWCHNHGHHLKKVC